MGNRKGWLSDQGNGWYCNPVLHADYSDPDVIQVDGWFYMTASSFNSTPGLPILKSRDLVNWTLIGHAVQQLSKRYDRVQHGCGVWAPSIRYQDDRFWIFYGDPDEGIYRCTAEDPAGPWSPLHLVREAKGWIDPCPFWDDDGQAYLVHAFAKSRSGIKSKLQICRMSPDGTRLLDDGVIVFDGTVRHPTLEGPKMYKRNGYYYLFAPAGGVSTGWQTVFRSRNPLGPYEDRIVLHQGNSAVNGPHQGGYVELKSEESWFMHFQDKGAYGRIVHLQPMSWEDDWPVIGRDANGDGVGEPVAKHRKPKVTMDLDSLGQSADGKAPADSDGFDEPVLGLQWQWQANYRKEWFSLMERSGWLRLYAHPYPDGAETLYEVPQLLCQKLPASEFSASVLMELTGQGVKAGLTMFGHRYTYLALERSACGGLQLIYVQGDGTNGEAKESRLAEIPMESSRIHLKVAVEEGALCYFQYSLDGGNYSAIGEPFLAEAGGWTGAKLGLFCLPTAENGSEIGSPSLGWADFDGFLVEIS